MHKNDAIVVSVLFVSLAVVFAFLVIWGIVHTNRKTEISKHAIDAGLVRGTVDGVDGTHWVAKEND